MSTSLVREGAHGELVVTGRARRVRCKMCLDSREVEVETWDDRVDPVFDHDCKGRGPTLSNPVTRDGTPVPFFPIGDRCIVERIPEETMIGGFHIPETSQAKQQYATLIAAGPVAQGVLDDAGISVGDTVCFGQYTGVYWEWSPPGASSIADRRRVDLINVKDIFGSKELAEKMIDGRLGIALYDPGDGGAQEYRFMKQIGPKETNGNGQ